MAGLPHAVSGVLNDKVLTFLNRANKVRLGAISVESIRAYYEQTFHAMGISVNKELLEQSAKMTEGLPYLMQLIGYYLTIYSKDSAIITEEVLNKAHISALRIWMTMFSCRFWHRFRIMTVLFYMPWPDAANLLQRRS